MALYAETFGSGSPVVLIHGWGMNSCILRPMAEQLAKEFEVTLVDLPGHGRSEVLADMSCAGMVAALREVVPEQAVWAGWSLGGMLALAAAAEGGVHALVMLAASPRFVSGEGWANAMQAAVMEQFKQDLRRDYRRTLSRFLVLQTRDSEAAGQSLCRLKKCLEESPPSEVGLDAGMGLLGSMDLRENFRTLSVPCEIVLGERDTLVPVALAADIEGLNDAVQLTVVTGAGHAPMLSHESICVAAIKKSRGRS